MTAPNQLRDDQYGTSKNLVARASIYQYETTPFDWFGWVFERLIESGIPADARIIDIGGGPGVFWKHNAARIPAGWRILHTDFSPGVVDEARAHVSRPGSTFEVADAAHIPHVDGSFDAVTANHMLYHTPDRALAIAEFARILKPGGQLFATTSNARSNAEIKDLIPAFNASGRGRIAPWPPIAFSLEDGRPQLEPFFNEVELQAVNSVLEIPYAEPLVGFIASRGNVDEATRTELLGFVRAYLQANGPLRVNARAGMFVGKKK